ncbi:MAG: 3-dehydroquinate synthase [Micrococcaceae bacterium]
MEVDGYSVIVGHHLTEKLSECLGQNVNKVLIIHPGTMREQGDKVREHLIKDGYEALIVEIPDAEEAKNVQVAAFCWEVLGKSDFTRSDAIISLGGGATTDLAGFVAATWLRGIKLIHMPTTVLAMVDAAVGGKTAINTTEGKNLVGSFYKPAAVLADLDYLKTLPQNELRTGLAESIKCGFISDEKILELFEETQGKLSIDSAELFEIICRSIQVKADIVRDDFTEQGNREYLNYGHTLGHAIEHAERYRFRHGAAISIGMVFAAELGGILGKTDEKLIQRHRDILGMMELPTSYPASRWETLLSTMRRDKKARGSMLRFVVLQGQGKPTVVEVPDPSLLFASYQEIAS